MIRSGAAAFIVLLSTFIVACDKPRASPFPEVDREKLRISLTRGGCYGSCPDYKVTIDGHGRVIFSTPEDSLTGAAEVHREFNAFPFVVAPGRRGYSIDPKIVDSLVQQFKDANFFALKNEYSASMTDAPTYAVEIDTGNGRKQIIDYVGSEAGMPAAVTHLEKAVDAAAQTGRWVYGANGLVDALAAEGFDFHSQEAAQMLLRSIKGGGDDTLIEFVRRGAPLDLNVSSHADSGKYGAAALLSSVQEGRTALFDALVRLGWMKRISPQTVADAFVQSGAGCSAELAEAAVRANVPIDVTSSADSADLVSAGGGTALSSLGRGYSCDNDVSRLKTAARLLALGANPNHRDAAGKTAIFGVEHLDLLNLLLAKGADAKVLDKKGASAIFDTWTDDIVLRLLEAGARPKGRYYDGKNLWEQMKERPMPKVKAWLAGHPAQLAEAQSK